MTGFRAFNCCRRCCSPVCTPGMRTPIADVTSAAEKGRVGAAAAVAVPLLFGGSTTGDDGSLAAAAILEVPAVRGEQSHTISSSESGVLRACGSSGAWGSCRIRCVGW